MGVLFYEDQGGDEVYSCKGCGLYFSHDCYFISSAFIGASGTAMLFSSVINVEHGPVETRHMVTGLHRARDVSCKRCRKVLGWYYEYTDADGQQYKESCTILEVAFVSKEKRGEKCYHSGCTSAQIKKKKLIEDSRAWRMVQGV